MIGLQLFISIALTSDLFTLNISEISTDFQYYTSMVVFKDDKKKKFPFSLGGSAKKIELHIADSRRAEVITCTGVCSRLQAGWGNYLYRCLFQPKGFFFGGGARSELINVLGTIFKMRTFFFFFSGWLVKLQKPWKWDIEVYWWKWDINVHWWNETVIFIGGRTDCYKIGICYVISYGNCCAEVETHG